MAATDVRIGRSLFDAGVPLPTFVIRETALAHDIAVLAAFARSRGLSFAPHGKTTMAPAIFRRQVEAGAWAITVAHTTQAAVAADAGVTRIFIANEVVDDNGLDWIGQVLDDERGPELIVYADSVRGVERMAARLSGRHRRLKVLVEVGAVGGRTGVRTVEAAEAVATALLAAPPLVLAGVAMYEGAVPGTTGPERDAAIRGFAVLTRSIVTRLEPLFERAGVDEVVVSGGGSQSFDHVVDELAQPWDLRLPVRIVLRSGAYITHDHGLYEWVSPFGLSAPAGSPRLRPAIEVWAPVLSVPEPGLAFAGAGRRDLPTDQGLPVVLKVRGEDAIVRAAGDGFEVTRLNDQHAFIALTGGASLHVGDLVAFGISHPCTAFQLWREALIVDDDDRVIDVYELRF